MMTSLNNRTIHVFESKDTLSKGIGDYVAQIGTSDDDDDRDSVASMKFLTILIVTTSLSLQAHTHNIQLTRSKFHSKHTQYLTNKIKASLQTHTQYLTNKIKTPATSTLDSNKTFSIALSGGSLPKLLAKGLLAHKEKQRFQNWHVFFADERCVDLKHEDSNFRNCMESFLASTGIPRSNIHAIDASLRTWCFHTFMFQLRQKNITHSYRKKNHLKIHARLQTRL